MNAKRIVKIVVDVLMTFIFIYLLAYRPGSGLLPHGILGITLFVLFIVHHILNINWFKTLRKGQYNLIRTLYVVINFLFLIAIILMLISAMTLSGMIFYFTPFPFTHWGHWMHSSSSAWAFLLMSLHLGLHTHSLFNKIENRLYSKQKRFIYVFLVSLITIVGIAAFATSGLVPRMFTLDGDSIFRSTAQVMLQYVFAIFGICSIVHFFLKKHNKAIIAKKNTDQPANSRTKK